MNNARRYFLSGLVIIVLLGSVTVCSASPASAQNAMLARPADFSIPAGLRGKVDFWKLIFAKYGEQQYVFHHREHPEIVYSVLDLTEDAKDLSPREFAKKSGVILRDEYQRIKAELLELSEGRTPTTSHQRRLVRLFQALPGRLSRNLRDAADDELIRYQRGIRERFSDGLRRAGRYLPAMEQVFEEMGLPLELTRIPLIESSFDYTAYSSVGAAGIWQFMRGTGKKYLRIDASIDQRRDPIFATRAAAHYLAGAFDRLGTWPLAVTSYNHGITGVLRGANQVGSRDLVDIIRDYDGESFGFASKNFYAEFLAALDIEQNQSIYFPELVREDPWHFEEVHLGQSLSIGDLARRAGVSQDDIERLNPSMMKPIQSGRVRIPANTAVMVPYGSSGRLVANLKGTEVVTRYAGGGRLQRVGTVVAGIDKGSSRKGSRIRTDARQDAIITEYSGSSAYSGDSYEVKRGDTVSGVAKKFGVSAKKLQEANNLGSAKQLKAGKKLLIPRQQVEKKMQQDVLPPAKVETSPITPKPSTASSPVVHTVAAGQTLGSIARQYKIPLARLMEANSGLNPKKVRVGTKLNLPK